MLTGHRQNLGTLGKMEEDDHPGRKKGRRVAPSDNRVFHFSVIDLTRFTDQFVSSAAVLIITSNQYFWSCQRL